MREMCGSPKSTCIHYSNAIRSEVMDRSSPNRSTQSRLDRLPSTPESPWLKD